MVEISRGVFLRGTGWTTLGLEVVRLLVYAIIGLALAAVLNKRRSMR
jgi:hypothetical protein